MRAQSSLSAIILFLNSCKKRVTEATIINLFKRDRLSLYFFKYLSNKLIFKRVQEAMCHFLQTFIKLQLLHYFSSNLVVYKVRQIERILIIFISMRLWSSCFHFWIFYCSLIFATPTQFSNKKDLVNKSVRLFLKRVKMCSKQNLLPMPGLSFMQSFI